MRVKRPHNVQSGAFGETSEPTPLESNQTEDTVNSVSEPLMDKAVEEQQDCEMHPHSDKEDSLSADKQLRGHVIERAMSSARLQQTELAMDVDPAEVPPQASVITVETDESHSDAKHKDQVESGSDLNPTAFTALGESDEVDSKTNSSPESHEPQSFMSLHSGFPDVNQDSVRSVEKQVDPHSEKLLRGTVEAGEEAPNDNDDADIVKPPPRKRLRRRMGMCGLGDRMRRFPCGGQNSRTAPAGKQNEEENVELLSSTLVEVMDGGTILKDAEGAPGPTCTDISEGTRGDAFEKIGNGPMSNEPATCRENRDSLRSNTFEKNVGRSVIEERPSCKGTEEGLGSSTIGRNIGCTDISSALEKKIENAQMDDEGATCRENQYSLRSNTSDEDIGTSVMDDGATGQESGDNEERLRSDTLEENTDASVMADKGAAEPACRENKEKLRSTTSERKIDVEEATRAKSRDNTEELRSNALEKISSLSKTDDEEEEATRPESGDNKERLRSNTWSPESGGTLVMEHKGVAGPDNRENGERLRSNTSEININASKVNVEEATRPESRDSEERLRRNVTGTTLMDHEVAPRPKSRDNEILRIDILEENIDTVVMADGVSGTDNRDNIEKLRSNTSEKNIDTSEMNTAGATRPKSRDNDESLRSDTLEDDAGTSGVSRPDSGQNRGRLRMDISEKIDTKLMDIEKQACTENVNVLRNIPAEENSSSAVMVDGAATGEPPTERRDETNSVEEHISAGLMGDEGSVELSGKEKGVQYRTKEDCDGTVLMDDVGITGATSMENGVKNSALENSDALVSKMAERYEENVLMVLLEEDNKAFAQMRDGGSPCEENSEELRDPISEEENDSSELLIDEGTAEGLLKVGDFNESALVEDEETTTIVERPPLGLTNGHEIKEVQDRASIRKEHDIGADDGQMNDNIQDIEADMNYEEELCPSGVESSSIRATNENPGEFLSSYVDQDLSFPPNTEAANSQHSVGPKLSDVSVPTGNGLDPLCQDLRDTEQIAHDGGDVNTDTAPPAGSRNHTRHVWGFSVTRAEPEEVSIPIVTPAAGEADPGVPLSLTAVTDSQLNSIALSMELEDQPIPEGCDQPEDATELICGLIRELSSMNRTVMTAHREVEHLRRGSRLPKAHVHRSGGPRQTEI